jgi:hypothetical protein
MNGPHAPFDRLRVNGWEEFKKEYVQSIMDPLVIRSEECGSSDNKERYLKEISDYVDQKEGFGINSCNLLLSFGLEAHRNFKGGLGL